jgi:hypothetical protein
MEDMKKLWEYGVTMWDEYSRQHFNLKAIIFYMINENPARLSLTGRSERHDVLFVWIRRNQFTFHLLVSLYTCGIVDSYHVNTSIDNGEHSSMVRLKMKRHQSIKMANLCLKWLRTST